MKIRFKLIFSFAFLIVLTALLYGFAAYHSIAKPLRNFEETTSLQYSKYITFQINEILEHLKSDFNTITRENFINYVESKENHFLHPVQGTFNLFQEAFIQNATYLTPEGTSYSISPPPDGYLVKPKENFELSILPIRDSAQSIFRISKQYYDSQGSFAGAGFIFFNLNKILDERIFMDALKDVCVCIRNDSGKILFTNMEKAAEENYRDLVRSYYQQLEGGIESPTEDASHINRLKDKLGHTRFFVSKIPSLGLHLFIEPDFLGLENLISSMSLNMLLIGIAIVWMTVWTALIVGYRIMKPIEELSQGAERISSGEYNFQLDPKSNDEIGTLAQKFNEMAGAIQKRTKDLEKSNLELTQQDQQKNRFLDTVAHDLRTPLTSIRSYADLLLRFPDEEERTKKEFLEIILKESGRMASLINDYLDLTKLESGTLAYRMQKVDLAEMIREFERINQGECGIKKISLKAKLKSPLPQVLADPDRLSQVFSNLISNAIRYTPEDGEIVIEADHIHQPHTQNGPGLIQVTISDDGPGIPDECHEIIFDKFRQLDNQGINSKGGTGLGLPISKEIIHKHSGKIWLENSKQRGAVFKFSLPVHPA